MLREQEDILIQTAKVRKEAFAKRQRGLKEKLRRFQANALKELTRVGELFPDDPVVNNVSKNVMARLRNGDRDPFKVIGQVLKKLRRMARAPEGAEARQALSNLKGFKKDLKTIMGQATAASYNYNDEQKEKLRALSYRQGTVKKQIDDLQKQLKTASRMFPSLNPNIIRNVQVAESAMGKARTRLATLNVKKAISAEQEALKRLSESHQQVLAAMQQLAQRGQFGRIPIYLLPTGQSIPSGRRFPLPRTSKFPQFRVEGKNTELDTENFQLPAKDDYKVPPEFREEILQSLKKGVPDQFKDQIESYFKHLY